LRLRTCRFEDVKDGVGELPRVVARFSASREQIGLDCRDAVAGDRVAVAPDGTRTFRGVCRDEPGGDAARVHQGHVDEATEMPLYRANVIGCVVPVRLSGLGEQVHDEDAASAAGSDRFPHSVRKHARDDARVQAARPEDEQVRLRDRFQRALRCRHRPLQRDPVDPASRARDGRLPADQASVGEPADQLDAAVDGRQYPAAHSEQRAGDLHSGGEVAESLGERREHHVADGVTAEAAVPGESVLEQGGEGVLASGERDETVANVARTRQAVAAADVPGASAVIAGRDDPADLEAGPPRLEQGEAAEEGGKTGPAAHGDDAQGCCALHGDRAKSAHDLVHGSDCCTHGAAHCNASV
jgi:hypothetical protein